MNTGPTQLRLQAHQVTLTVAPENVVSLAVGPRGIGDAFLHHDPPTPHELEQAIDAVETALMRARLAHAERGALITSDPLLHALPGLWDDGSQLSRDDVEALFQRLASASLGHPTAHAGLPAGNEAAAALLILRECMHHLGFASITFVAS